VFRDDLIDFKGAAVAMDVNTGEVLAMVSYPDYDLNDVSPTIRSDVYQKILEQQALVNRAVNGFYPPGSAFKLVVSIAGLRSGIITPSSTYTTDGTYRLGRQEFHDHHGCITGEIDFRTAIEQSVNTYFINFGLQLGVDRIHDESARLGLTGTTGIELPEQKAMYVGNDAWKRGRMKEGWREGDTANLSFGQGFIQVTPLQMASFMASLARGQTTTKPSLLHDPNRPRQQSESLGLTASQSIALTDGMQRVITKGTAAGIFGLPKYKMPGLTIAAKTGTAQKDATVNGVTGKVELAWFVGYAPVENPQIAVAVIVEGDTPDESFAGGRFAGPVAAAVMKKWWEKKNPPAAK
jgi:penicillin-binding protein 2